MLIYYYLIFFSCNLNIVYTKKNRGTAIFGRDFWYDGWVSMTQQLIVLHLPLLPVLLPLFDESDAGRGGGGDKGREFYYYSCKALTLGGLFYSSYVVETLGLHEQIVITDTTKFSLMYSHPPWNIKSLPISPPPLPENSLKVMQLFSDFVLFIFVEGKRKPFFFSVLYVRRKCARSTIPDHHRWCAPPPLPSPSLFSSFNNVFFFYFFKSEKQNPQEHAYHYRTSFDFVFKRKNETTKGFHFSVTRSRQQGRHDSFPFFFFYFSSFNLFYF